MDFFGFHMPAIPRHLLLGRKTNAQAQPQVSIMTAALHRDVND
jgi:hypothetical protein